MFRQSYFLVKSIGCFFLIAFFPAACDASARAKDEETYTLYRSSDAVGLEIFVAAFDSTAGIDDLQYNQENCEQAALLFNENPPGFMKLGNYYCRRGKPQR